ncbi:hypothetical protein ANRL2_02436 [Anaerolineae bacterium]|nr:hypothetical protein ANRL2_02436 [Anaerolineae bacterium]
MAKKKEDEILKLPVILDGFAFKKQSQDWNISFTMQSEHLEMGKPLMNHMGDHFVLMLVKIKDLDQLRETLKGAGLEGVKI